MKSKLSIVLACWPDRIGQEMFGDRRRYAMDYPSDAIWLSLRQRNLKDPEDTYYGAEGKAVSNTAVWAWISHGARGPSFDISVRAHDIHSAELRELEFTVALIKRMQKRMPALCPGETAADYVLNAFSAWGITHAVEYRGIGVPDNIVPMREVAPRMRQVFGAMCTEVESFYNRMEKAA